MLASTVVPGTNIVAITYGGPVTADEMLDAREELDAVVDRCGTARLLVEYGHIDVGRVEPTAMWADLTIARLLGDVDKVAVVTDAEWIDKLAEVTGAVGGGEVRSFGTARRPDALAWLRA